jgi:hypothetical protein
MIFTIFNNGVEKSLADWGLDDLRITELEKASSQHGHHINSF